MNNHNSDNYNDNYISAHIINGPFILRACCRFKFSSAVKLVDSDWLSVFLSFISWNRFSVVIVIVLTCCSLGVRVIIKSYRYSYRSLIPRIRWRQRSRSSSHQSLTHSTHKRAIRVWIRILWFSISASETDWRNAHSFIILSTPLLLFLMFCFCVLLQSHNWFI